MFSGSVLEDGEDKEVRSPRGDIKMELRLPMMGLREVPSAGRQLFLEKSSMEPDVGMALLSAPKVSLLTGESEAGAGVARVPLMSLAKKA